MRIVALVIRFKSNLASTIKHKASSETLKKNQLLLGTSLMEEAKSIIIKMVQKRSFNDEFKWLKSMKDKPWVKKALERRSKILRLDPFLNKDETIRVGGRLGNCFINNNCKHLCCYQKMEKLQLSLFNIIIKLMLMVAVV